MFTTKIPKSLFQTHLFLFKYNQFVQSQSVGYSCSVKYKDNTDPHSTVDQDEIKQHSKLMTEWWNPTGPMKALHAFNMIRVPFVRDGILSSAPKKCVEPLKDKKILDIGCGGGILSEPLAKLGADVTGVDASKELIELAQQHSCANTQLKNKPTYLCTSIEDHSTIHENHYDGVVASEIIEHITNKQLFIKCCIKVLKPGGRIFFTTPNRSRTSQALLIFVAENILNVVPRGTHQVEKFTTPTELTFLLERSSEDKFCFVATKPNASIATLRHKIWKMLDLPDYCEEVITLKSRDVEIPLKELRNGNDPQHPFLLEVWLPGKKGCGAPTSHNMLTMGQSVGAVVMKDNLLSSESTCHDTDFRKCDETDSAIDSDTNDTVLLSKSNISPVTQVPNHHFMKLNAKDSELSCRISSTSLLFKLQGKKNRDNFANILFKIQSDLMNLGNKISDLENRLPH